MAIKNIPFLCLSFVILSASYPGFSAPVSDDLAVKKPTFEPPREYLVVNNEVPASSPETPAQAASSPAQPIAEKLAHTNMQAPSHDPPLVSSEHPQPTAVALEAKPVPHAAPTSPPKPAGDKDDIVIDPADIPVSPSSPWDNFHPITLTPAEEPTPTVPPAEALEPTTLSIPPTVSVTTPAAHQFYSLSTNPYATFTSSATMTKSTKPSVPLPSQGLVGESENTRKSRRTAVIGCVVALSLVLALVGFVFCLRCRCGGRKRRSLKPLDLLAEDHERESLAAEKDKMLSPDSSPLMGVSIPILKSHSPHTVTFADPPDQQQWRVVAATHDGQVEDITHVISGDSFTDINLNSHPDLYLSGIIVGEDTTVVAPSPSVARSSVGVVSMSAPSYSTRASEYSGRSSVDSSKAVRSSASFDKLNQLASLASVPAPISSVSRTRHRSNTDSAALPPQTGGLKRTKSLPSITSYENRFSNDSARTRKTSSVDSEWDVAQAYGARFSKESAGARSILSTISEAESMEAVEVGGKQCVLVKGKF